MQIQTMAIACLMMCIVFVVKSVMKLGRSINNMWKTFYEEMPSDNCKIVAIYDDGSGASLFQFIGDKVVVEHESTEFRKLEEAV